MSSSIALFKKGDLVRYKPWIYNIIGQVTTDRKVRFRMLDFKMAFGLETDLTYTVCSDWDVMLQSVRLTDIEQLTLLTDTKFIDYFPYWEIKGKGVEPF